MLHRHTHTPLQCCAGKEVVSVNSHQNSHDAQQKCQMTSCVFFLTARPTTEQPVVLDIMVKCNSLSSCIILSQQSQVSFIPEGMIVVVLLKPVIRVRLTEYDHSSSSTHWSIIPDSSTRDDFILSSIQKMVFYPFQYQQIRITE